MVNDETTNQMTLFQIPGPPVEEKKIEPPPSLPETTPRKPAETKPRRAKSSAAKNKAASRKPAPVKNLSGQVPDGDVRLTANIREDLHLKLKIAAAKRRTTIGELIEEFVATYL